MGPIRIWRWVAVAAFALGPMALAGESTSSSTPSTPPSPSTSKSKSYHCKAEVQTCLNEMVARLKNRGWVGIVMEDGMATQITILRVVTGSPAETAGLAAGDVLVAINGIRFDAEERELAKMREGMVPGARIEYTLLRKGLEMKIGVKLGELPSDVLASWIGMHMLEHHAKTELAKK
jgi:predicted metalloprotease with PDZ domain